MTGHSIIFQTLRMSPVVVVVSPASLFASRAGAGVVTTAVATATVSGGVGGPYTYTWDRVSGNTQILPTAPNSATSAFTANLAIADSFQATFTCTATDVSGSGISNTVGVTVDEVQ